MRFTVKLKILMAMTVAFLVALAVGAVGLDALEKTYADVDNMYHQSLTPIIAVANVRSGILDIRTAVDRGLAARATDAAASTRKQVDAGFASVDKEWTRYYPSMANPGAEAEQARAFAGQLGELRSDTVLVLDALAAGKADVAAATVRDRLDPVYASATASIDRIVSLNEAEAAEGFAASAARHHATLVLVLCALAFGLASLAVASVLLIRAVIRPLRRASSLADTISRGELGNALEVSGNDELSDTLRSLSAMEAQLTLIVGHVRDGAEQVAAAARTISDGSDDLSTRSQVQAAALEETAASMKEMTSSVRLNAEGAEKAKRLAITLRDDAKLGAKVAQDALDAMARVSAASRNIDDIAVLIEEIAFQTNLLALNAAVEAARAGAQGRGFAVVAAEVRDLASRSAHATKDIKRLIAETRERVDVGVGLVENTNTALNTIEVRADIVADIVSEIAGTSQEQSAGIAQVSQAVNALDEVTQRNALVVEQTSGASRHAMMLSRDLLGEVSYFRHANGGAADQIA